MFREPPKRAVNEREKHTDGDDDGEVHLGGASLEIDLRDAGTFLVNGHAKTDPVRGAAFRGGKAEPAPAGVRGMRRFPHAWVAIFSSAGRARMPMADFRCGA